MEESLEELKRAVAVREKDAREAFERYVEALNKASQETILSKQWEALGRVKAFEQVWIVSIGKVIQAYREYTHALEARAK